MNESHAGRAPLSARELASLGGRARRKKLAPERRREIAADGGRARARKLSFARRKEIARQAIATRWEADRLAGIIKENFRKIPLIDAFQALHV